MWAQSWLSSASVHLSKSPSIPILIPTSPPCEAGKPRYASSFSGLWSSLGSVRATVIQIISQGSSYLTLSLDAISTQHWPLGLQPGLSLPVRAPAPRLFVSTNTKPYAFAVPSVIFGVQEFFEYSSAIMSTFCSCPLDMGDVTTELPGEFPVHPLL